MKIMSINTGSSSLKFSLFNMDDESVIASGLFERIGLPDSNTIIKYNGMKLEEKIPMKDHADAVNILLDKLVNLKIVNNLNEIDGIGHRVVHGKDKYNKSVVITDEVVKNLDEFKAFAPLHNGPNIVGIKAFREILPNKLMVGTFDTAFHQTMEPVSYLYSVPLSWYEDYGIRKYGFHGTSHRYINETLSKMLNRNDLKIISCHLGNGGSICAIDSGKSIDTTMGFTPLTGIMMGTRSGDVDPSIIPYVMEKEGKNASEVVDDLNKKSGLLGMSEKSSDMRDIIDGMNNGDEKCTLAFQKYCRCVTNYIAQYYVLLGGADAIVFTAGLGENSMPTRRQICENLSVLGVKLDLEKNKVMGETAKISAKGSKIDVYVIPTNEELMIARDVKKALESGI